MFKYSIFNSLKKKFADDGRKVLNNVCVVFSVYVSSLRPSSVKVSVIFNTITQSYQTDTRNENASLSVCSSLATYNARIETEMYKSKLFTTHFTLKNGGNRLQTTDAKG
jgi:hypothetical protein